MTIKFEKEGCLRANGDVTTPYSYYSDGVSYCALYFSDIEIYTLSRFIGNSTYLYTDKGWTEFQFHELNNAKFLIWNDVINIVTLDIL